MGKIRPKLIEFTVAIIRTWGPCYNPTRYLDEASSYTVVDILKDKNIPPQDRLWAVCREDLLDAGLLRRFAVAQAKSVRKHIQSKDKKEFDRILRVCVRFSKGKATQDELSAARSAAWSAVERAAWSAAWSAAGSAAWNAAWSAAWSGAENAAWSAAWSGAESAAWSAAGSVACRMLLKMVREHYKT